MLTSVVLDGNELVDSGGTVVNSDNFTMGISLKDSNEIKINVHFITDLQTKEKTYHFDIKDSNEADLKIVNSQDDAAGGAGPIPYATYGNGKTYILISWNSFGKNMRRIDYSVYQEVSANGSN